MGRQIIELVQVLVDRIHQGGYTQRALEDDIYAESQKRVAAERDRDHWKQARQDAHEAGELMRAEIERLRQQLAEQQAETVDVRRQRNNETDRLNATNVVSVQQRDEIAYLRTRLDEERSVSAGLRQQLDAANAAWNLQCAGIERLQAFVARVREVIDNDCDGQEIDEMIKALDELDGKPAPVAEPLDAKGDTCHGK